MSDELRFPGRPSRTDSDSLGEPLAEAVRSLYAPPVAAAEAAAYWAGIERRVMAQVRSGRLPETTWLSELVPWARAGLVAAAAIFALAGVVNRQITELDEHFAADSSLVYTSSPEGLLVSQELIVVQDASADGEAAALRYYLSN